MESCGQQKKVASSLKIQNKFWRYTELIHFWVGWTKFPFYALGQQELGQGCIRNKCGCDAKLLFKKGVSGGPFKEYNGALTELGLSKYVPLLTIVLQISRGFWKGIFCQSVILKSGAFRGPIKKFEATIKDSELCQLIIMNTIALQIPPGFQKCNI